jgi:hypothetical protein
MPGWRQSKQQDLDEARRLTSAPFGTDETSTVCFSVFRRVSSLYQPNAVCRMTPHPVDPIAKVAISAKQTSRGNKFSTPGATQSCAGSIVK